MPDPIVSTIDDVLTCQLEGCAKPSAGSEFCSSEHLRAWHEQFVEPLEYSPDAASVYPGYDSARWSPEGSVTTEYTVCGSSNFFERNDLDQWTDFLADERANPPTGRRLTGEEAGRAFADGMARGIQEGQELLNATRWGMGEYLFTDTEVTVTGRLPRTFVGTMRVSGAFPYTSEQAEESARTAPVEDTMRVTVEYSPDDTTFQSIGSGWTDEQWRQAMTLQPTVDRQQAMREALLEAFGMDDDD